MSNIDKQALRRHAIAATKGSWVFSRSGVNSNVQAPIELQKGGRALVVLCKLNNAGWSGQIQTENNAKFIAAANPVTVLALLDELDAAEKRIAELEEREVAVKQFDDFHIVHYGGSEDYAKGYIDCQNNYNKALSAAGIGVKGE
ncbi:TPA: ead/Ea22-like family protein [Escherichia coli]|nr:ead/Ea22-like family protein [Escherichia coli]